METQATPDAVRWIRYATGWLVTPRPPAAWNKPGITCIIENFVSTRVTYLLQTAVAACGRPVPGVRHGVTWRAGVTASCLLQAVERRVRRPIQVLLAGLSLINELLTVQYHFCITLLSYE